VTIHIEKYQEHGRAAWRILSDEPFRVVDNAPETEGLTSESAAIDSQAFWERLFANHRSLIG
jgi:hypothetical protein